MTFRGGTIHKAYDTIRISIHTLRYMYLDTIRLDHRVVRIKVFICLFDNKSYNQQQKICKLKTNHDCKMQNRLFQILNKNQRVNTVFVVPPNIKTDPLEPEVTFIFIGRSCIVSYRYYSARCIEKRILRENIDLYRGIRPTPNIRDGNSKLVNR